MAPKFPQAMMALIHHLEKLPSIGPRTASRLAFFLLDCPLDNVRSLSSALLDIREKISPCKICGCLAENDNCPICNDSMRDQRKICVVAKRKDIFTIDESGAFQGLYHVLNGLLSPLDHIGPSELAISTLLIRLENIDEVILATPPTVEGDATALYISNLLARKNIKATRLAYGLPAGGDLELADSITLMRALEGRRAL